MMGMSNPHSVEPYAKGREHTVKSPGKVSAGATFAMTSSSYFCEEHRSWVSLFLGRVTSTRTRKHVAVSVRNSLSLFEFEVLCARTGVCMYVCVCVCILLLRGIVSSRLEREEAI